ncbi:MAG: FtsX-like permease family protein [Deltaproteobacteria bacterium]|nr:FtsX-like permease family protein [Deltaproteobacteria bacterium]
MKFESFLAFRYLRAKRSSRYISAITGIGLFGVTLGTCALVVVLSVMGGFEQDLKVKILGANAHVRIRPEPGRGKPWFTPEESGKIIDAAKKIPGVVAATPYVQREAMITAQSNLSAVIVKGIDLETAPKATFVADTVVEPKGVKGLELLRHPERIKPPDYERFESDTGKKYPGVLIGEELKKNLVFTTGERVTLTSPTGGMGPSGRRPRNRAYRIAGVFRSGYYEYDSAVVYITREEARKLFRLGGDTAIEIKLADADSAPVVAASLRKVLGPGFEVRDWTEMNQALFHALKLEKIAMFIILTLIVLVASFNIAVMLVMVVIEKQKEVAILKSMGATNKSIRKIFILNGLAIGLGGTVLGIGLGLAICFFIQAHGVPMNSDVYYYTDLPVSVNPIEVAATAVISLLISFFATVYPSTQAARQQPVQGLRLG